MKKTINQTHIEGRVYQHDLAVKTVQNQSSVNYGKPFITGNLDIAIDEDGLNIVTVHYTYVTDTNKNGKNNTTYTALNKIIEGKAWITDGKDEALKVKIDTSIALNDFYTNDGTLVSAKRFEGGFVTLVNDFTKDADERNKFTADMLVTSVRDVEADPERNIENPYIVIRGAIFNYKNDLLPVEFIVKSQIGIDYFKNADISNANPMFTKVWGSCNCMTTLVENIEESAFGEASVRTYEKKTKEWLVTGASKVPYDFGDEAVLTAEELTKAMQNREVYLADIKKSAEEWRASKAQAPAATPAPSVAVKTGATFNF